MTTSVPPHNMREVIDGTLHLIDHPKASVRELMQHIPGPDFPTAGFILGRIAAAAALLVAEVRRHERKLQAQ